MPLRPCHGDHGIEIVNAIETKTINGIETINASETINAIETMALKQSMPLIPWH